MVSKLYFEEIQQIIIGRFQNYILKTFKNLEILNLINNLN